MCLLRFIKSFNSVVLCTYDWRPLHTDVNSPCGFASAALAAWAIVVPDKLWNSHARWTKTGRQ